MKYLHTMVRVTDLEKSIDFYCNKLGLKELRRYENEKGRFTLVFLGARSNPESQVELTYNWDPEESSSCKWVMRCRPKSHGLRCQIRARGSRLLVNSRRRDGWQFAHATQQVLEVVVIEAHTKTVILRENPLDDAARITLSI
jgi:catechol 2,3-dioxygenase-like lactoylglutathione lyase family enzyme